MKFSATISRENKGRFRATCHDANLGQVEATGDSREQAIEKLRGELRYRLELCPCTGESYQHLEIEVVVG
jgi:hypothetical protein